MEDLLSQIRLKGSSAASIANKLGLGKSTVTMQIKGQRTLQPNVQKEIESILGYNLIDLVNGKETIKKPLAKPTEPIEAKIAIPHNAYDEFKEFKKAEPVSDNALKNYDKSIGRFLIDHPIESSSKDIIKYLNQFPGNKFGFANRHFHWRNLKTFYKWLELTYDYPNPIVNKKGEYLVPEPYVDKESVQPSITKEEVLKLLKSDQLDSRDKALIAIPYFSSMRLSEWSELKVQDIAFNTGMVKEVVVKGRHLTAKSVKQALPYIKAYLDDTGIKLGDLFQATAKYKALHPRGIEKRFKEYIEPKARVITSNADLVLTPHVFRRGFARLMQESKVPDTVAMLLGSWKSQKLYKKYGNALTVENASEIASKSIDNFFNDAGLPTLNA